MRAIADSVCAQAGTFLPQCISIGGAAPHLKIEKRFVAASFCIADLVGPNAPRFRRLTERRRCDGAGDKRSSHRKKQFARRGGTVRMLFFHVVGPIWWSPGIPCCLKRSCETGTLVHRRPRRRLRTRTGAAVQEFEPQAVALPAKGHAPICSRAGGDPARSGWGT